MFTVKADQHIREKDCAGQVDKFRNVFKLMDAISRANTPSDV